MWKNETDGRNGTVSSLSQKEKENEVESTPQNRKGHWESASEKDHTVKYRHLVKSCRNQIPRDASQSLKQSRWSILSN